MQLDTSAIEGMIKLDPQFVSTPADFAAEVLDPVKEFVSALTSESLRSRLLNSLSQLTRASASKYLAKMERDGRVTSAQVRAWKKVRNQVAHGNLFEPWADHEEYKKLVAMIELFYRLTALRIGYS